MEESREVVEGVSWVKEQVLDKYDDTIKEEPARKNKEIAYAASG